MEGLSDFTALQQSIQSSLVAVTRTAQTISAEDLGFHRSLDPTLATALDKQNARLLGLAESLLGNAASNTELVRPRLADVDGVDGNWSRVVDVIDSLLEKADISLDEYTGAVKRLSPSREQTPTTSQKPSRIAQALRSQDMPKPQLLFQHVPTNAEAQPFKPLLAAKPHATIPFAKSQEPFKDENGLTHHQHPYQQEIEQYHYPSFVYTEAEPIPYLPYESTTAILVDTEEKVDEMLEELKRAKEIAIDLEHHDSRSYIGIVSLMQISTRDKDWVVDTLKPWRRNLSKLNEVFADPRILKVLHGAFMDIMWLQRDLGLYIVGLFDTHFASRALGYTGGSLAFLLKKFVNFDAQKQYQTADWRIRPLPQEMFEYARSDTHFLLYIYDNMRNELIARSDFSVPDHEKDKIHDVLSRSRDTALQRYEHPVYDAQRGLGAFGWYKMLSRTPALLTNQQFAVFRAVHQWRDSVAREQDDSVHYVMANHNIFSIAKEMPTERPALFAVAQPTSQTVRLRVDELLAVISKAKEEGTDGPDMVSTLKEIETHIYGVPSHETPTHAAVTKPAFSRVKAAITSTTPTAPALNSATNGQAGAVRSKVSSFWGSLFGQTHDQQQHRSHSTDMRLSVPLPALTAEIFATETSTPIPAPPQPPTPAPTTSSPPKDEIFTLKERSRKRKSDAISSKTDGLATNADEVVIPDTLDISPDEHSAKRAEKRRRKAEKQAAKEEALAGAAADEEEEPFDYATAPTVLDGAAVLAREEKKNKGKKSKKEKPFNPYAKALDTAKGLPRAQRERAGKTMTFRK